MNNGEIYDRYFIEIQLVMRRYHAAAATMDDAKKLLELRRQENTALLDLLQQQKRALAYAAGEVVEPETLFAEAVIRGVGQ
jgi:hypothetical protein